MNSSRVILDGDSERRSSRAVVKATRSHIEGRGLDRSGMDEYVPCALTLIKKSLDLSAQDLRSYKNHPIYTHIEAVGSLNFFT